MCTHKCGALEGNGLGRCKACDQRFVTTMPRLESSFSRLILWFVYMARSSVIPHDRIALKDHKMEECASEGTWKSLYAGILCTLYSLVCRDPVRTTKNNGRTITILRQRCEITWHNIETFERVQIVVSLCLNTTEHMRTLYEVVSMLSHVYSLMRTLPGVTKPQDRLLSIQYVMSFFFVQLQWCAWDLGELRGVNYP